MLMLLHTFGECGGRFMIYTFVLLFVIFACYCMYVKYIHMKYDHIPGPPRDSFLFGHSPAILRAMKEDERRMMDPAFSNLYLRGMMDTFNEVAEDLMEKLEELAESHTSAHMHNLVNCVTLSVIAKVAFGIDLNLLETESPFPKAIEKVLNGIVYYIRDPMMLPWKWKFIKEVKDAIKLLRKTGEKCITERKRAMRNGESVPKDILTQILKSAEQDQHDDLEQMLDNFLTFFIAGQETTANQLSFAIMELGRHPEILKKLRKEIDDVLGAKKDIEYEDLGKLTYLSQVLKETLRLYPPAPGTSRWVAEDMVISGIHVPGGAQVLMNTYVTGRMEEFFPDPLKFDPERFHPDAPKPYFTYFPFALGPRSCIGKTFSQMEAKVVLSKLVQRFEMQLIPDQSFDIMDTGTLRPRSGVVCNIRSRSLASG
uniref:Cholesterol 24-hydroxylase n=1 Tax=Scleropages formosus TaxID=113540 RepID=A0A8C9TIQ3_SCLFO